jgi:hypothetical protein
MRVSEITQRLLDQSKEGPRFHDLLRIYQIQNMALAEKPRTSSNYVGTCASLPFNVTSTPSQQSRPPLEISDFRNFENVVQSRKTDIGSDGTSSVDVPSFHTRVDTISICKSPIEPVLPPIISSGEIHLPMNLPKIQAMLSSSKKGLIHTASTRKHTTELSLFRVRRSYSKSGKRLRSTWNSASELAASLLLADAVVEYDYRQTAAGGQEYIRSLGPVWNIRPAL